MIVIAETARLILRETSPADAQFAYELNLDPEVIRYTGDEAFASPDEARYFLASYDHFKKYGSGRWAVVVKDSGETIGWCGLKYHEEENFYDLGFRFFKKCWGKGYATEAALKCLELGFKKFDMPEITGRASKENRASCRVLEKIGMRLLREEQLHGENVLIYSVSATKFSH